MKVTCGQRRVGLPLNSCSGAPLASLKRLLSEELGGEPGQWIYFIWAAQCFQSMWQNVSELSSIPVIRCICTSSFPQLPTTCEIFA